MTNETELQALIDTDRAARDAVRALYEEIDGRAWDALKATAAPFSPGSTLLDQRTLLDAEGREIGWCWVYKRRWVYERVTDVAGLVLARAAYTEASMALHAASKAAGLYRPKGEALVEQRRRSRLGTTRPAGTPRAHHYATADV